MTETVWLDDLSSVSNTNDPSAVRFEFTSGEHQIGIAMPRRLMPKIAAAALQLAGQETPILKTFALAAESVSVSIQEPTGMPVVTLGLGNGEVSFLLDTGLAGELRLLLEEAARQQ